MNPHPKPRQPRVVELTERAASPYLTTQQTVVYLNVPSVAAIYRLIREHNLPFGRVGGQYRFDVRELDAWVRGFGSALEQLRAQKAS